MLHYFVYFVLLWLGFFALRCVEKDTIDPIVDEQLASFVVRLVFLLILFDLYVAFLSSCYIIWFILVCFGLVSLLCGVLRRTPSTPLSTSNSLRLWCV